MSRVENNAENRKLIDKTIKNSPKGIEETKVTVLEGIYFLLEDISISLAIIADKGDLK